MANEKGKKILLIAALAAGAYAAWEMLKGKSPQAAVKNTIEKAVDAPAEAVKTAKKAVKRLVKGSPEAKAHMAKLREKAAAARKTKKSGGHKGHKTKKGLAQDQKLKSDEKHEKAYRKSKK